MAVLLARAADLMDQGCKAREIAVAMNVAMQTAKGYICGVRRLRGLTKKTKRVDGPIRERFEAKVDRNGPVPEHRPELGPCHVWIGAKQPEGYGHLRDHKGEAGPPDMHYRAHRLAWILANGPIPDGLLVRHKCDRPSCVNLAHLELGTQKQNIGDVITRGRLGPRTLDHCRCSLCHEMGHRKTKCPKREAA